MNRPPRMAFFSGVWCAAVLLGFSVSAFGQTPPEIESLASRTADRIAKSRQQHVLVASLQECQLDLQLCAAFEASLRADLEKVVPGIHFVKRENVINILEGRGFLALDAFFPEVLKAVASSAGADVLVTDTLEWQRDGFVLICEVFDAAQHKKPEQFRAKIPGNLPDADGEPLVFTDPESGVAVIIPRGKPPRAPIVEYPSCEKCPNPPYTQEAQEQRIQGRVQLLATVTAQGTVERVGVIDGLDEGLTVQAVDGVQLWHYKPAKGKDGKPFATRLPIEVTFHLN
jgi:TonB family protein